MTHKYAIGDIVLLHNNPDDMRQECWVEAMDKYAGCIKVIDGYHGKDYTLRDCDDGPTWQDGKWHWSDRCFDGLAMYPAYDTVAKKLCLVYGRMVDDEDQMLVYYLDGSGVHDGGSFKTMCCPYAQIPERSSYWAKRSDLHNITFTIDPDSFAEVGEYVLIKKDKGYTHNYPNIPLKVAEKRCDGAILVRHEDHFAKGQRDDVEPDYLWFYTKNDYETVECIKDVDTGEIIWRRAAGARKAKKPQEIAKPQPFQPYWAKINTGKDSSHYAYVYALGGIDKNWPLCYDPGATSQHDGNGTISTAFIPGLRVPPNHSMYYPPSDVTRVEFVPNRSGRTPKVGDFIRVKRPTYTFDEVGKILPICKVDGNHVYVTSATYFTQKVFDEGGYNEWCYSVGTDCELLDVTHDTAAKTPLGDIFFDQPIIYFKGVSTSSIAYSKKTEVSSHASDYGSWTMHEEVTYLVVCGPTAGSTFRAQPCDELDKCGTFKRLL